MFALLLITFVNFVGIGALIPVLPYAVIEHLGYSETVMSALLVALCAGYVCRQSDIGTSVRQGRAATCFACSMIGTAAHLWFALSNDIISMFAARIIAGLSAGNIGVTQRLLPIIPVRRNARIMGFLGAAIGSGFVLALLWAACRAG